MSRMEPSSRQVDEVIAAGVMGAVVVEGVRGFRIGLRASHSLLAGRPAPCAIIGSEPSLIGLITTLFIASCLATWPRISWVAYRRTHMASA
jgi:hypothetical protein